MIPPDSLEAADIPIRKPLEEAVKMNECKIPQDARSRFLRYFHFITEKAALV